MADPLNVQVSPTPNPNAMKFTLNRKVTERSMTYVSLHSADGDPAAKALFALPGVTSLFFLNDFITISKKTEASWDAIVGEAEKILREHFAE